MSSSGSSTVGRRRKRADSGTRCRECDVPMRRAVRRGPEYCVDCGWTWRHSRHFRRVHPRDQLYIRSLLSRHFPLDESAPSRMQAAEILLSSATKATLFMRGGLR